MFPTFQHGVNISTCWREKNVVFQEVLQAQFYFQMALGKKAPKRYLEWLRERDQDVVDNMPDNVPSFKGVNITRYMLEEANEEVLERLLNVSIKLSVENLTGYVH